MAARTTQLRVALITGADLRRGAAGGTRTYVIGLTNYLVHSGLRVVLIANGPVDQVPPECEIHQVAERRETSSLGFQRALRSWSRKTQIERLGLLHFQRPDDVAAYLPHEIGSPILCTLHGNPRRGIRRRHGRLAALFYLSKESRCLNRFAAIIAVDEKTADTYRRQYPSLAARLCVIPVGVDDVVGASMVTETTDIPRPGTPLYVYAGRLSAEKRVERIIGAFLAMQHPTAELVIAGTGPEECRLRRLADGARVRFLGAVAHGELMRVLHCADAVVLASEFEGIPTVALEALAAGCPVVATSGSGLDPILREAGGVLVDDLESLQDGMEMAARLKSEGRPAYLPEDYYWSHVGREILAVYAECAPGVMP